MPRKIRRWRKKVWSFYYLSLFCCLCSFVRNEMFLTLLIEFITIDLIDKPSIFGKKTERHSNPPSIWPWDKTGIWLGWPGGVQRNSKRGTSPRQYTVCVSEFKKLSCKFNLLKFFGDKVCFRYRFLHPLTFLSYDTTTNLSKSGWMPRKK